MVFFATHDSDYMNLQNLSHPHKRTLHIYFRCSAEKNLNNFGPLIILRYEQLPRVQVAGLMNHCPAASEQAF